MPLSVDAICGRSQQRRDVAGFVEQQQQAGVHRATGLGAVGGPDHPAVGR